MSIRLCLARASPSRLTGFRAQAHHPLVKSLLLKVYPLCQLCRSGTTTQKAHSPMLGLDESRVDADGPGKLGERSTRNVDSLALHLEAVVSGRAGGGITVSPCLSQQPSLTCTHADFWAIEVSNLRQTNQDPVSRPSFTNALLDMPQRLTRSMRTTR